MEFLILTLLRAGAFIAIGLGFALVFGAGRVLNLSHGMCFLLGAYFAHWWASVPILQNLPLVTYGLACVSTSVAAWLFFRLVLRPATANADRTMVLCLAANFAGAEILRSTMGSRAVAVPKLVEGTITIGEVSVATQQLLVLPYAAFVLAATGWVLSCTRAGRSLRAVAQDPGAAAMLGIHRDRVFGWTFVTSGAMAAAAACLITPLSVVGPSSWISPLLKAFAVVVLGGSTRLTGLAAASGLLAAAEVGTALWISEGAAELISVAVIVTVLAIRPGGILGTTPR